MSEELSGKNRGILGCPPALGDKPVNGRKVQEERWKFPSQNLGTGKLITSRGTSLIWTNRHERGGGGGRVTLPSGNFWSRFRLLSVSLLTNVYFRRWDFVSEKKKKNWFSIRHCYNYEKISIFFWEISIYVRIENSFLSFFYL